MYDFFKKNRLRISVLIIVVFLLLYLVAQIDKPRSENWFSSLVQLYSYPIHISYHYAASRIEHIWSYYVWLVDVKEKNLQLRKRLKRLEEENAESHEIRIAYQRLLKLLEFKKRDRNKKIFAEVVVEIDKAFSRFLIINKGSNEGIRPNFGVVTPEGIIGKIQSVTAVQSVVQLITDHRSKFPVLIQETRTKAMLHGTEDGTLEIKYIPQRLELNENDTVVTSGLAGIFPKGLPVGKIKAISKKKFELFQSIILMPTADLKRIEEVVVIANSVDTIHKPLFTDIEK